MKLVSMKRPKQSKTAMKSEMSVGYEQEKYPYGLKINLEDKEVDKLPSVKKLTVGDKVMVHGQGHIVSVRKDENQSGNDHHRIEIQIEDIAVEPTKKKKDMSMDEYKTSRGQK
jgi:hypothetical protein